VSERKPPALTKGGGYFVCAAPSARAVYRELRRLPGAAGLPESEAVAAAERIVDKTAGAEWWDDPVGVTAARLGDQRIMVHLYPQAPDSTPGAV
jgi:hypothetical protein